VFDDPDAKAYVNVDRRRWKRIDHTTGGTETLSSSPVDARPHYTR
jgi:hypothetical protein